MYVACGRKEGLHHSQGSRGNESERVEGVRQVNVFANKKRKKDEKYDATHRSFAHMFCIINDDYQIARRARARARFASSLVVNEER